MKSGYKLHWSERALADLKNIIDYLTQNWTERDIRNFAKRLDKRLEVIVINVCIWGKIPRLLGEDFSIIFIN